MKEARESALESKVRALGVLLLGVNQLSKRKLQVDVGQVAQVAVAPKDTVTLAHQMMVEPFWKLVIMKLCSEATILLCHGGAHCPLQT